MTFQEKLTKFLDNEGYDELMALIAGMDKGDKYKAIMALLPYGTPKYGSVDYNAEAGRDLTINLMLDPEATNNEG